MRGRPFIGGDVARHPLGDAGAQHLDGDVTAFRRERAVDLRDGGGAHRHLVEAAEQLLDGGAEARLHLHADRGEGEGRQ